MHEKPLARPAAPARDRETSAGRGAPQTASRAPAPPRLQTLADVIQRQTRRDQAAASASAKPVQLRKKEARSFIVEHGLDGTLKEDHGSIAAYVADFTHPLELRHGLRDAWNDPQAAHWRIADDDTFAAALHETGPGESPAEDLALVRQLLGRAAALLDEANRFFLPFPQPLERQYLVNRLRHLDDTFGRISGEFLGREREKTLGTKFVALTRSRLRHPDFLPLLEKTMPEARRFEPSLAAKLTHVFGERAKSKQAVHYGEIAHLVDRAGPEQRREAGDDEEVLGGAARLIAPDTHLVPQDQPLFNHAPEFVQGLDIQHAGTVVPHGERAVDKAIRAVLGRWVHRSVQRGSRVRGNVRVLKNPIFSAVEKKYTGGAASGANAFTEEGTIYLNANRGDASTIIHEGIHLYAHGDYRTAMGGALDEGTTEYFARKVAVTLGYNRANYPGEFANAARFIGVFGEDAVAKAYFDGNMAGLKTVFTARLHHLHRLAGDGTAQWDTFRLHLADRKWADAFGLVE